MRVNIHTFFCVRVCLRDGFARWLLALQIGEERERVPGPVKTALTRAYARSAPLTQALALVRT